MTLFGSVFKSAINLSRWSFLVKRIFFGIFFHSYRILEKKFEIFSRKVIRSWQKCRVRVHGINLRRNIFGTCMFFFVFFFDLWVHNSQTSYKIFEKLCPICILRFRKNIWTKKTVYEKKWFPIMSFGTWAENLWTLVEQFMRGCRSCILRFQSCILKFSNLVESQIYFFTFLGFWGHNYKMLVKTFRKDCANCLLRAQEKFLTKGDVIEKNIVFYQVRTVIEKL